MSTVIQYYIDWSYDSEAWSFEWCTEPDILEERLYSARKLWTYDRGNVIAWF